MDSNKQSCICNRKVGFHNSETGSIGNVFHSLDYSIGVNVSVGSTHNSISSLYFLSDRVRVIVAKTILSRYILCVILSSITCRNCLHSKSSISWSSMVNCGMDSIMDTVDCMNSNRLVSTEGGLDLGKTLDRGMSGPKSL